MPLLISSEYQSRIGNCHIEWNKGFSQESHSSLQCLHIEFQLEDTTYKVYYWLQAIPPAEGKAVKGKKDKGKAKGPASAYKNPTELSPPPEYIAERELLWGELKAKRDAFVAAQVPAPIKVTLPDGTVKDAESWKTTPYDVARSIRYCWFGVGLSPSIFVKAA